MCPPSSKVIRPTKDNKSRIVLSCLLYVLFFFTAGSWLLKAVKYHGVEEWPSVEARSIEYGGDVESYPGYSKWGHSATVRDSRWVSYEYEVNGVLFRGATAGPDLKDHPREVRNAGVKVFYKPTDPATSVLTASPYEGTTLLLIAMLSGCAAVVHAWCFFADRRDKNPGA